jgi:VWA domain-containing protein
MAVWSPSASRAWMTSLVLHTTAGFAAIVAILWPKPAAEPLQVARIDTRAMGISLVLLAATPRNPTSESPLQSPKPLPETIRSENQKPFSPDLRLTGGTTPAPPGAPATAQTALPPQATTPTAIELRPVESALPLGAITAFCGVPAIGSSVVFVIDRSASMGLEGRFDRARAELTASLRRLPSTARFQIIAYNRHAESLVGSGLRPVTSDSIQSAIIAVERLKAEGGTDHTSALRAALALRSDVICFLTDDDELTPQQVREITRFNRAQSCIHALCFIEPIGDSWMPELARQNRGQFRVIEKK